MESIKKNVNHWKLKITMTHWGNCFPLSQSHSSISAILFQKWTVPNPILNDNDRSDPIKPLLKKSGF